MTEPAAPRRKSPAARLALRAALSAAILAGLFLWLPVSSLLEVMGRVPLAVWAAVVAAFLAGHAVSALKWRVLLGAVEVPAGRREALRAHAAGLFANLCLPSVVGGDLVRAGLVGREHRRLEAVAVASLADRLNDALALLAVAALGAAFAPLEAGAGARALLVALAVGLPAAGAAAALALRLAPRLPLPGALARVLAAARRALQALLARPGAALRAFALSLLVQGSFAALNVLLARAMGLGAPAAVWVLGWSLAKLLALAPVSLGGLGVRELALAALLAPFGVGAAAAVAQSLCWEVVLVLSGLGAGGLALALGVRGRAPFRLGAPS